ncbi:MAG: hypothetical protein IAF38_18760 [Bacteroidia bacterium]|nr:hypothetical protein [Bacteroidia bacterium]
MPDTLEFHKPEFVRSEISLDSILKRTFYKTQNPTVYFFDKNTFITDNQIMMAVPRDKGFLIFTMSDGVFERSGMKFERFDFDGKGSKELIIRWKANWSHMAATYSTKSENGGTQIWNLDSLFMYLNNHDYYTQTWKESEDPFEGERPKAIPKKTLKETQIEETEDNFRHIVNIKKGQVKITCAGPYSGASPVKYTPVATYLLKGTEKKLLVKQKKNKTVK